MRLLSSLRSVASGGRLNVKKILIVFLMMLCFSLVPDRAQAQEQSAEGQPTEIQPEPKQGIEKKAPEKQDLLKKIEELEDKIDKLTEQNRARQKLEITQTEKEEREKERLEAVSTEYTLDPAHTLGIDYGFNYSYDPAQTITDQREIERRADHTITHTITATYSVLDSLSVNTGIPFVFRYTQRGTRDELDQSDIGDISLGLGFQPYRAKTGQIRTTLGLNGSLPTGRSPYKINPDTELSTGDGVYGVSFSGSFSQEVDPVVAFWNVGFAHSFPESGLGRATGTDDVVLNKVELGDSFSFAAGLGYAMSYKVSVNAAFSYSYEFSSTYTLKNTVSSQTQKSKSPDSAGGGLSLGVGWRASEKTTLSFGLSYSLTGTNFSLSIRAPFSFVL
jgi:hypothetical protein